MKGWVPPAILAVVATIALAIVLGTPREQTHGERADEVARGLRCPDCQGLSVADSPTASAAEIRRQIDELIASGASSDQVRAHFVERYGEWILLAPASPIPWIVPFAAVGAGAAVLTMWLGRHRVAASRPTDETPGDDVRRRLHEEAEALDA